VIVVDTSAWVELLRSTRSTVHQALRRLILERADLAVTEIVVMEILAGARDAHEERELRGRLFAYRLLPLRGIAGYEQAAELHRACRSAGETVRTVTDCLVAVPTIEAGATLLHADADFEVLARHSTLRLEPLEA
jgi:predicted nucleic acid-binding protein